VIGTKAELGHIEFLAQPEISTCRFLTLIFRPTRQVIDDEDP
jgi:hypothetical protein